MRHAEDNFSTCKISSCALHLCDRTTTCPISILGATCSGRSCSARDTRGTRRKRVHHVFSLAVDAAALQHAATLRQGQAKERTLPPTPRIQADGLIDALRWAVCVKLAAARTKPHDRGDPHVPTAVLLWRRRAAAASAQALPTCRPRVRQQRPCCCTWPKIGDARVLRASDRLLLGCRPRPHRR